MVARLLGRSRYGLVHVDSSHPPIIPISLSDTGIDFALVSLAARVRAEGNYARASRLLRLGFLLKLAISTVAFIARYLGSTLIATAVLNRPELAPFLRLASSLMIFQAAHVQ